ncbi:hypothetical protein [Halorussus halophilus]|uniref:hypothetical protein n=1 Tax=Halorussus halophilus TaxID=2650975 RepID=UPI0017886975|nr:hypothetical protein [Halorussus halophilus]
MKYKPPTKFAEEPRDTYTEYTVGSRVVAMIEDTENEHAWIQSTETCQVRR